MIECYLFQIHYRQAGVNEQFPRLTHCYLVTTFPSPAPLLPPPVNNAPPPPPSLWFSAQDHLLPNHHDIPNQTNTTTAITYQSAA